MEIYSVAVILKQENQFVKNHLLINGHEVARSEAEALGAFLTKATNANPGYFIMAYAVEQIPESSIAALLRSNRGD